MVPVEADSLARSFSAQLASLHRDMRVAWQPEAPEAGFAEWAAAKTGTDWSLGLPSVTIADIPAHRWKEAPILAATGYRLPVPGIPEEESGPWLDGMDRLMTRDPVPADRNSFFFRPVELLGLAAGASALAGKTPEPARWLNRLLDSHRDLLPQASIWNITLAALAARELNLSWSAETRHDPRTPGDAATLLWLHLVDHDLAAAVTPMDRASLTHRLLNLASTADLQIRHLAEQGVMSVALQWAIAAAIGDLKLGGTRPSEFIAGLCRRFPLFVTQLGSRHNDRESIQIADEYDVQDLLRSILHLHFDHIQPEEWNPSYAGVQSRSDLMLKPERIVIETKMTRRSLSQRQLVHQLIVDKAQYQAHPDCDTLICYVYDPVRRLKHPTPIETDLSGTEGKLTTIVVVGPRGI